jgi:hypothetical protein
MQKCNFSSAEKLGDMYADPDFQKRLERCQIVPVELPRTKETELHEAFCCREEMYRHIDSETGEAVLLRKEYIRHDGTTTRVILFLCNEKGRFRLRPTF